jgi:hypothetical protein
MTVAPQAAGPIATLASLAWPPLAPLLVLAGQPSPFPDRAGPYAWSGTMELAPFAPSLRNWSAQARAMLHDAADRWLASTSGTPTLQLVIRPHHRHILSDHHSVKRFFLERATMPGAERLRLLADPAALLTRAMVPLAEDHLVRAAEDALVTHALSTHELASPGPASTPGPPGPALAGVVMCNLREPTAPDLTDPIDALSDPDEGGVATEPDERADTNLDAGPPLIACPLHAPGALLSTEHIAQALAPLWRAGVPIVVLNDSDLDLARALLQAAPA